MARSAKRRWWGERPTRDLPELPHACDAAGAVDERTLLEDALGRLPVRQRAAVVLRYYYDLSDRQVADTMDCPVGTASSLASRGLAKLRTILAEAAEPALKE